MCTEGTRVRILEDITKWANSPESPRVVRLTGQAGSGKTTIAYTIAKQFEKNGTADQQTILGGNFLCSRQFGETRNEVVSFPP
jgi:adenylylsulfate kinase-like enzyme